MTDSYTLILSVSIAAVFLLVLWAIKNYDELKLNFEWGKEKKSLKAEGKKHSLPKDNQSDRYLEEDSNRN